MLSIYKDPLWDMMDFFNKPFESKISKVGLKSIGRPHNLVNVKDEQGNVIAQKLSVVTTPFKKSDVHVTVKNDCLTVRCGNENMKDEENEDVVWRGISSQSYEFSLTLSDKVDQEKITAENVDGILTVTLPIKTEEDKDEEVMEISVK